MASILSLNHIIFKINFPYDLSLNRQFIICSKLNFLIRIIYQIFCNLGKAKIRFFLRGKKYDEMKKQIENKKVIILFV